MLKRLFWECPNCGDTRETGREAGDDHYSASYRPVCPCSYEGDTDYEMVLVAEEGENGYVKVQAPAPKPASRKPRHTAKRK